MFASKYQSEPLQIPGTEQTCIVRKLTGAECEESERVALDNSIRGRSARGWAGKLSRIFAGETLTPDVLDELQSDPLAGHDRLTLARRGLVSWTCEEPTTSVSDLDDDALQFIATEVMRMTKPERFMTPEQRESATKKA